MNKTYWYFILKLLKDLAKCILVATIIIGVAYSAFIIGLWFHRKLHYSWDDICQWMTVGTIFSLGGVWIFWVCFMQDYIRDRWIESHEQVLYEARKGNQENTLLRPSDNEEE